MALCVQRSKDAALAHPEPPFESSQAENFRRGLLPNFHAQSAVIANIPLERAFHLATILGDPGGNYP